MADKSALQAALLERAKRERTKRQSARQPQASIGHKVGATIDGLAQGLTFGFSDEIAAGLDSGFGLLGDYDKSLEAERARMAENKRLAGGYHLAGEVPGMVASTIGTGGVGLVKGASRAALEGAKLGAVTGAGYSEADLIGGNVGDFAKDVATSTATGAILGPVAQKAGKVVGKVAGRVVGRNTNRAMPELDDLYAAGSRKFDEALDGVIVGPEAMNRAHKSAQQILAGRGYHPKNQPGAKVALKELERLSSQPVTGRGLQSARQLISGGYRPQNDMNNRFIGDLVGVVDDVVAKAKPGDLIAGDAAKMARVGGQARKLWSKAKKLELLQKAMRDAHLDAVSTGSGGNVQNTMLQAIKRIVKDPKKTRGFTKAEIKAMEDFISSHKGAKATSMRVAGKLAPGGNGLMAALGLGAAAINPMALAGMGAAQGIKTMSERGTARGVEKLMRQVAGVNRPLARTKGQRLLERVGSRKLPSGLLASGLITIN